MLVTGFPAGVFAANCYLVAPAPGEQCVIVDPGQDAEGQIGELLARYRLKPIAVLLTHGHIDHVWSVAPVCGARGIPAYVHPDDRALLADPAKGLALSVGQQLFGGITFTEPDDVRELADGETLTLGGCEFTVGHVPGHTPGSVTFRIGAPPDHPGRASAPAAAPAAPAAPIRADNSNTLFSGDLLFAGSIGRTDLPGGDDNAMLRSLARTLTLPDDTLVLPGHGPQTTIGAERRTNPFLTGLQPARRGL
ncbi:MBL fold metallo-hydrolase [Trebonia sp.]|uniref:MBL fold metallo-hydrolase n=1 Tax=Trebonia sp. TaxID=2767075 RepID=UPI002608D8A3|nr:MBL fold metallo-hydrolase [Trebonia sp.]